MVGSARSLLDTSASADDTLPAMGSTECTARATEFVRSALAGRGESHGLAHALAVRDLSLFIWHRAASGAFAKTAELAARGGLDPERVIEIAAIMHDVCDHKYVDPSTVEGRAAIARRDEFLARECGSGAEAEAVRDIIANVSYSREAKGKYDPATTLAEPIRTLRDVVSDADKLEAIGVVGLARCIEFRRETAQSDDTDEAMVADVAQHCDEKLLRLASDYIRTAPGQALAAPRHRYLAEWREAARALASC